MCDYENYESDTIPRKFLEYFDKRINPKFCRIATIDSKQRPFIAAFRFSYDDSHIFVCSFTNRYTVKNISANPNVSVIVDRNDEHPTSYCLLRGKAKTIEPGKRFDYALELAHKTNPGLDNILGRFEKGEYNKGGEFVMISVDVEEIFSRMV